MGELTYLGFMGRIVIIFLLVVLVAVAATVWSASSRAQAALRDFPPTGAFITVDGTRLHYRQAGSGPDLVLIHGSSGNIRDFDFGMFYALATRYRVTAFDRPGLGHSDPIADPSIAAQVALIKAAATDLGITRPIVVGQSYGGSLALEWGLQGGPVALVLISSPSLPWPGDLDPWYRLTRNPLGRALGSWLAAAWVPDAYVAASVTAIFAPNPAPAGYAGKIGSGLTTRASSLAANASQINALRAQLVAMEPLYPRLTLPIELIHGDADTIVPLKIHSAPLSLLLPDAHLTVLPGVGHMPHHAALPQVLAVIDAAARRAGLR